MNEKDPEKNSGIFKKNIHKLFDFTGRFDRKEEIILRDYLAIERTKLANERTLLSYIRASLYLVIGGIAFLGMEELEEIKNVGIAALCISITMLIIGIIRFYQLNRQLKKLYRPVKNYKGLKASTEFEKGPK